MKKVDPKLPRALDHVVLPVASLEVARSRYEMLGFTVAPDGLHPFGTENCCIFFNDETMLEPLAIAHRETCEAAALSGNTFVQNDQAFRFRRGVEGFSHLVLKSDDAEADDGLYREKAMSGGEPVKFSRDFSTPDGETGTVSFLLAFAEDQRAPDAGFFSCEVQNAPKVDRSALKSHANGALGMVEVVTCEPNPSDFQYFLQTLLNQREVEADSFGISLATRRGHVTVLSPDGMKALFNVAGERNERGLRHRGVTIAVQSLEATRDLLSSNSVLFHEHLGKLIVEPAPGQGCFIAFSEQIV